MCRAGQGSSAPISTPGRVTITPLLLTPSAGSSTQGTAADAAADGSGSAAAAAASAEADGTQEPAAKKPRHEAPAAGLPDDLVQAAAAAAGAGSSGPSRGLASVQSSSVQPTVVCYVCQLANIPGKFDPKKAAQLGVPKGPVSRFWG